MAKGIHLHGTTVELRDYHLKLQVHKFFHSTGTHLHGTTVELRDDHLKLRLYM